MSLRGKRILWHVSAHGWGHAARQRELIRVLTEGNGVAQITVASSAPAWFWRDSRIHGLVPGPPSPIAVESRGKIDIRLTGLNLRRFLKAADELLVRETELLGSTGADLVVTDIDPLPVLAASEAGIPAVGIGNFTWDWILRGMLTRQDENISRVSQMYWHGTYLRLPLGPDHSPFRETVDLPLLRAGPEGRPERAEALLPRDRPRCLVAFRHLPPGFPVTPSGDICYFTSLPEPIKDGFLNITEHELSRSNATFADLVAAADLVVTKPGYGIVSQILADGKRALFFASGDFPEEEYLLAGLRKREGTFILEPASRVDFRRTVTGLLSGDHPAPLPVEGSYLASNWIRNLFS